MKQIITVGQLQELSKEQKNRLREWWKPKTGDHIDVDGYGEAMIVHLFDEMSAWYSADNAMNPKRTHIDTLKLRSTPLLSIGQCIELLKDINEIDITTRKMGTIDFYFKRPMMELAGKPELIDALWEAIKQVT